MPESGVVRALSHFSLPYPLYSPCKLNDLECVDPCSGNCVFLSLTAQNDDDGKLNVS